MGTPLEQAVKRVSVMPPLIEMLTYDLPRVGLGL